MANSDLIVVSQRLGALGSDEERIMQAGFRVRSAPLWNLAEIRLNGADAGAIIVGAVEPFDAQALAELPATRAIVRRGIGVDNVDVVAATELGIVVANVPDASVDEVAEHALAMLLALERRIFALHTAVRSGQWQRDPSAINSPRSSIRRVSSLTLGIVGLGRIGRSLAHKASGIYARIVGADPFIDATMATESGVQLVALDQLLEMADHISLHLPLTIDTRHLIGVDALSRVRSGAVIVNTARGGVIDEPALLRYIAEGRVTGAGLDVTEREPLPAEDPLLALDRVLLTGHSAHSSTTAQAELARRSVDAAIALLEGRHPGSVVNTDVLESPRLRIPKLSIVPAMEG